MELSDDSVNEIALWLPSNACNLNYKNVANNFRIDFPKPFALQGQWKAALTEIYYPHYWNNIKEDAMITFYITNLECKKDHEEQFKKVRFALVEHFGKIEPTLLFGTQLQKHMVKASVTLPAGIYTDALSIMTVLNKRIKANDHLKDHVDMKYDEETERFHITSKNFGFIHIETNAKAVSSCLGLVKSAQSSNDFIYNLPYQEQSGNAILEFQEPALYVYVDFVDYSVVGDTEVGILRTVPVIGTQKTQQHVSFGDNKVWLRLNKGYINSVKVEIRDSTGDLVRFQSGKVLLLVQLKRSSII